MNQIVAFWKEDLRHLLNFYETRRGPLVLFYPLLFIFFVILNITCYWWAMYTAFPELTRGGAGVYYAKVQYPVGILGALFDSLSFFVTIYIIRRALRSQKAWEYLSHLSIDLVIAILATFWVVFVFTVSGWTVNLVPPQSLVNRSERYEQMVTEAVANPTENMRNIYFGLVMGISAMLPTCIHILMFLRASWLRMVEITKLKQHSAGT